MTPKQTMRSRVPAETYHRVKIAAAQEALTIEQMIDLILTSWLDERDAAHYDAATRPQTPPRQR